MTIDRKKDSDDKELVRCSLTGDLRAFEQLVSRYERQIYSMVRRITDSEADAQDATQQTFLSAMQHLPKFRKEASFFTWLATIAVNAALKIVRKQRGLKVVSFDKAVAPNDEGSLPHPEFIADWRENPEQLIQRRETRQLLDVAISELDPGYKAVFLLRDVEDLSVKETAKALHLSEGVVKVRLLRARLQLRERLTRVFGDEKHRYQPAAHNHDTLIDKGRRR